MHRIDMAGHLIRRLNQLSTQVFQARMQVLGVDLTSVQFAALDAVQAQPGIDQAGLAAIIGYDRATIGGVVDRLEQKGLLARITSTRDRRARELRLTATGAALLERLRPEVVALQGTILALLDTEEQAQFRALARRALGL